MIKQRVSEAVDKVKRQSAEEKQRIVVEANTKLRDAVSAARNEIEGHMAQAQALAVQEALKEANVQNSSKEVSMSLSWTYMYVCMGIHVHMHVPECLYLIRALQCLLVYLIAHFLLMLIPG